MQLLADGKSNLVTLLMNFLNILIHYLRILVPMSSPPFRRLPYFCLCLLFLIRIFLKLLSAWDYPNLSVLKNISGFVVKGCTDIFVLILKYIFNQRLSQQYFLTLWKQAAIVFIPKKGNSACVINYRPLSLLNIFSKLFEFVIHDCASHYLNFEINPY
jgi:hypothetical protein